MPLLSVILTLTCFRSWQSRAATCMVSLLSILTLMAGVGLTEAMRGTPATIFHGVPDSWRVFQICPLSFAAIVMTLPTLSPCRNGIRW